MNKELLSNNIELVTKKNEKTPRIALDIMFQLKTPEKKAGIYTIMNRLLSQGTTNRAAEEIASELEENAIECYSTIHNDYLSFSVICLNENFEQAFAKAGEEKQLPLTFPEDYHSEELAGQEVVFNVKVNEVKRKVLPELDDDFAKDVNAPGVETVEDLRKVVKERLENGRKEQAERKADEELFKKLSESAEIDLPQVMVEDEAMSMVRQFETQISQYGIQPSQYLKMLNQTEEGLKEAYMEEAERNVRLRLILAAIAKSEEMEVSAEEIDAEINKLAEAYNMEADQVRHVVDEDLLKKDILNQKASEFVKEHAARS